MKSSFEDYIESKIKYYTIKNDDDDDDDDNDDDRVNSRKLQTDRVVRRLGENVVN